MLFVNLGGENIEFLINNTTIIVKREDIESDFTNVLLDLYQQHNFTSIHVIQGPGSFTTIRLGVLLLNAFAMLSAPHIEFYTISKENLIQQMYQNTSSLPSQSILFIGQRKNARLYNNTNGHYDIISKNILSETPGTYLTDILEVSLLDSRFSLLSLAHIASINSFSRQKVVILEPHYAIEPNID